jgi:hypothetical protein
LITHANSVVNSRYIENLRGVWIDESKIPKVGSPLRTESNYTLTANARVSLLGFWVIQSVWRKLHPKETEASSTALISAIHDMLVGGYTKMARRLCEFALENFAGISEKDKAYIIINLALSHQLEDETPADDRKKGIEDALERRDWVIVNSLFALALCCLREDYESLPENLDDAVREGLTEHQLMTWALFTKLRCKPLYAEKMSEHFGVIVEEADMPEET